MIITQGDVEIIGTSPVGPGGWRSAVRRRGAATDARRAPAHRDRAGVPGAGGDGRSVPPAAAAAGTLRLEAELAGIVALDVAWGREALRRALERATTYRRFTAADVRAILAAGLGSRSPRGPASRSRSSCRGLGASVERLRPDPTGAAVDRDHGARRRWRRWSGGRTGMTATAPSRPTWWPGSSGCSPTSAPSPPRLQTATTQRWTPEALLRALITTEVTGRNAANLAARLKAAGFPVAKSFDDFQVAASSVPPATVDYVASLEWLRARENLCLIGPAGTGKSHLLVAAGQAAVLAGFKVKYTIAADLVETLYRGLPTTPSARSSISCCADAILVDEAGFAPLDDRHPVALPLRRGRLRAPHPGRRQPLAVRPVGALPAPAEHGRLAAGPPAPSRRHRRHRGRVVPHEGGSQPCGRPRRPQPPTTTTRRASGGPTSSSVA